MLAASPAAAAGSSPHARLGHSLAQHRTGQSPSGSAEPGTAVRAELISVLPGGPGPSSCAALLATALRFLLT